VADDLEVPGHVVQYLGDVLTEFGHAAAARGAGAGAVGGGLMHNLFARQVIGQRLALRLGTFGLRRRSIAGVGLRRVFGRAGFQFLEPQFELLDLPADPLR
jgi:hypothetical protein